MKFLRAAAVLTTITIMSVHTPYTSTPLAADNVPQAENEMSFETTDETTDIVTADTNDNASDSDSEQDSVRDKKPIKKEKKKQAKKEDLHTKYAKEGKTLTRRSGVFNGPSGKETYYNLNMSRVVKTMQNNGHKEKKYWVRKDGVKMLGPYIIVAADLKKHRRGSIVETSLGKGIVCDTGSFTKTNSCQLDIAVSW